MTDEQIARVAHEANRALCEAFGDTSQKKWGEAEDWQRQSAVAGVAFVRDNPDAPASAQHDAWSKHKLAEGWKFGPIKDVNKKEHPCLVSFDELLPEQQAKDYVFKAVVNTLLEIVQLSG